MLARRIVYRIFVAIAHNRGTWLAMSGLTVLMVAYVAWGFQSGQYQASSASAAGLTAGSDCADVTMLALASGTASAAHAAYGCLDASVRQQTTEANFVQEAAQSAQSAGSMANLTRVGDHPSPDGGKVVFYSLDVQHASVGYIIYLSPAGKVFKVE